MGIGKKPGVVNMLVILVFGRLRQKDPKCGASLGNLVKTLYPNNKQTERFYAVALIHRQVSTENDYAISLARHVPRV